MCETLRVIGACVGLIAATAAGAADATPKWRPLFNGKNLNGWTAHHASSTGTDTSPASTIFKVENGEIHAYATQTAGTQQPNAYLLTKGDHKDYVLSLEYKWGEKKFPPRLEQARDAGLLYHVHRLRPQDWPTSAEVQIQEGDTGDSWVVSAQVSSTVDPKTARYALPEDGGVPVTVGENEGFKRTRHNRVNEYPGWNTVEVIVRGDRATHIVNGVVNMRVSDIKSWDAGTSTWIKLDQGKIALLAESAEIFYRSIKVRPLTKADDTPPEPELTEVWFPVPARVEPGTAPGAAPSDAIVLFDGKSLDAWKSADTGAAAGWKIDNGEMVVGPGTGDIQTRAAFGDVQLHIEWRSPKLPRDKVGQDRGNSGIFLQDVYEVQMLDNFENPTYVNGMVGSIYKQFPPLVNATLPPETWNQTGP